MGDDITKLIRNEEKKKHHIVWISLLTLHTDNSVISAAVSNMSLMSCQQFAPSVWAADPLKVYRIYNKASLSKSAPITTQSAEA